MGRQEKKGQHTKEPHHTHKEFHCHTTGKSLKNQIVNDFLVFILFNFKSFVLSGTDELNESESGTGPAKSLVRERRRLSSLNIVSCYIESNLLGKIENNSLESKTDVGNYCPFLRELITEIFVKRRRPYSRSRHRDGREINDLTLTLQTSGNRFLLFLLSLAGRKGLGPLSYKKP